MPSLKKDFSPDALPDEQQPADDRDDSIIAANINQTEHTRPGEALHSGQEIGPELENAITRKSFLKVMGASLALMYLGACRRPLEEIVPFVEAPEYTILGKPEQYATTMPVGLHNYGILVTSLEGRPTKIEGNPNHPSSLGGTNAFMQASVLNLYDPDRSKNVLQNGTRRSWDDFTKFWSELKPEFEKTQGEDLAVISPGFSSPTLARMKTDFLAQFPKATWVVYDAVSDENIYKGIRGAFGMDLRPELCFDKAKVILTLDADPFHLDSENVAAARQFADGRRVENTHDDMNRLYAVESIFTLTGAMADHRLKLQSREIAAFTGALALELQKQGLQIPGIEALAAHKIHKFDQKWLRSLAKDLIQHKGSGLIVAGRRQPPGLHALVAALNTALNNTGHTVLYHDLKHSEVPDIDKVKTLVTQMQAGKVNGLLILGGDPVYNLPVDLEFTDALTKVKHIVNHSYFVNSTTKVSEWHLPETHFLEAWGDACAVDGSMSVIQPLISPLYGGRSNIEIIDIIVSGEPLPGHDLVRNTWGVILKGEMSTSKWRKALHDGILENSRQPHLEPGNNDKAVTDYLKAHPFHLDTADKNYLEVVFSADPSVYDGSYANNGWMQELPDPVTKLNWDNAALMSPRTAELLGFANADIARLYLKSRKLAIPVWIVPGYADFSINLTLGYGQQDLGRIAEEAGFNAYKLRTTADLNFGIGLKTEITGLTHPLSTTQKHPSQEDRPLIREATLTEFKEQPDFAEAMVHVPPLQSLWKEHQYDTGYQWGMTIDLNACIGCGVCTIACQSENNIPVVGKKPSGYGREMHWIRIDRYFSEDEDDPQIRFQPVACQHCEMAPCESVCPVAATSHDAEGLNVMTYNRCVGTRYCSNNCPYKVRRFNFYNYTKDLPEIVKMAQNPDVTVRSRGVMEKCSYCLQRLNRAKSEAKLAGKTVEDGDVMTACQQACPTNAIKFGNLLEKVSEVVRQKGIRNYELLAEFNTRPRTSYQARLRNPNPDLEG